MHHQPIADLWQSRPAWRLCWVSSTSPCPQSVAWSGLSSKRWLRSASQAACLRPCLPLQLDWSPSWKCVRLHVPWDPKLSGSIQIRSWWIQDDSLIGTACTAHCWGIESPGPSCPRALKTTASRLPKPWASPAAPLSLSSSSLLSLWEQALLSELVWSPTFWLPAGLRGFLLDSHFHPVPSEVSMLLLLPQLIPLPSELCDLRSIPSFLDSLPGALPVISAFRSSPSHTALAFLLALLPWLWSCLLILSAPASTHWSCCLLLS